MKLENSSPSNASTPIILELQKTYSLSTEEVEEAEEYISCPPEIRKRIAAFLNTNLKTGQWNESTLSNLFEIIQTPDAMSPKLPAKQLEKSFLEIEDAKAEETLVSRFGLSKEQASQVMAWYADRQRALDAGASPKRWILFDKFMVFVFGETYKYPFQRKLLEWDAGVAMKHNREIENAISLRNELDDRVVYDNLEALITKYCETHLPPRYKEDFEAWLEEDEQRWKVTQKASLEGAKEVIAELFGYENFFLQQGPREALLARSQSWNNAELPLAELNARNEFPNPATGMPIGVKHSITDDDGVVVRLHAPDPDLNTPELVSKQIPDNLFLRGDVIWNTREGDFPPSEIATHRFLQLHAKHPLIEGTGCPHVIGFKGVTQSDDQKTFYYWQEAGAETVATIIADGRKSFEKSLKKWYTGCKEAAKNGRKNLYMTERSPWTKMMVRWFIDILCAVKYMHLHGVAHRDLKVGNVVLCGKKGGLTKHDIIKNPELFGAKLIDFGLAYRFGKFDKSDKMSDYLGTLSCKSPESYQVDWDDNVTTQSAFASDVWQLGVMLYKMLAKKDVLQIPSEGDPNWYFVTGLSYPRNEDSKPLDLPEEEYTLRHKKMNKKGIKYNFTENLVNLLHEIFKPESERITIDQIFQDHFEDDIEELRKQKQLEYLEPYFRTIFPDDN